MENRVQKIIKRFRQAVNSIQNNKGFTLMEIMIVMAIIGILSIIVLPRFMDIPQKARIQAAKQQMSAFGLALDRYSLDSGIYPTTEQGLDALVKKPATEPMPQNYNEGGYMKKTEVPKDPWGNAYIYKSPGENGRDYEITSLGSDGKEGGTGDKADIHSWE